MPFHRLYLEASQHTQSISELYLLFLEHERYISGIFINYHYQTTTEIHIVRTQEINKKLITAEMFVCYDFCMGATQIQISD